MRRVVYNILSSLPSKFSAGIATFIPVAVAIWPDKSKAWADWLMTPEQLRIVMIGLFGFAAIYWIALWLLKPKGGANDGSSHGPITHGPNSPAIGAIHGGTVNIHPPPAAIQEPKSPYGSGNPPANRGRYTLDNLRPFARVMRDEGHPGLEKAKRGFWERGAPAQPITWWPLSKALHYLVYETEWASQQPAPIDEKDFDERVAVEFRERLARGEIEARGKAGTGRESLSRATEQIEAGFWIDAYFQPHGEIALADASRCAATMKGSNQAYRAIIVPKEQMERTWPERASGENQLTLLARFVEPLRAKIASEKTDDR